MIDLNSFKLLKEDSGCYEIQHPNGKSLKVDKKGMSEKAHALIKKLRASGNYDEGGAVKPSPSPSPRQDEGPNFVDKVMNMLPHAHAQGGMVKNYAQGDIVQPQVPMTSEPAQAIPTPVPPQLPAPPSLPVEQQLSIADKGYAAEQKAEKEKGQALSQEGAAKAAIIDTAVQSLAQMKTQNDIVDEYRKKDQALLDHYSTQKIDPDAYWKNQSTGAKIASGISLILGGMGAGLTHGRNMAQDLIENAISRDMEAQKNDQSKTYNLYQMNRAALGDDTSANLATQNQMLTALEYKLKKQASLTGSQTAKSNADIAIAQIQQKRDLNNQTLSWIKQGIGGGSSGSPAQDPSMLVPALVKDPSQQKQVIDEIERAKIIKNQYQSIMDSFDKASVDQRPMSGGSLKNAIPGVNSPYIGALHAEMGPTFQHLEGTVRQSAMDNMDKNITPQLGDSDEKIAVKRQALQDYLLNGMAGTASKSHGIDLNRFSSTALPRPQVSIDQQARDWAKANPKDPRAAKILEKSGLK